MVDVQDHDDNAANRVSDVEIMRWARHDLKQELICVAARPLSGTANSRARRHDELQTGRRYGTAENQTWIAGHGIHARQVRGHGLIRFCNMRRARPHGHAVIAEEKLKIKVAKFHTVA